MYATMYACPSHCPASRHIVLPDADDIEACSICRTSFFFDYEADRLAQRERIYNELDEAVRNVIRHDRTHHSQSHGGRANVASSTACSDSKRSAISSDGDPADADPPCSWQYGSGAVSRVCI
jgi:hypothetical protein